MTTRTKLYIAINTASMMGLLNVFSKPLHISETFQWVLILGMFIPLGLTFYFIKKQKQERQVQTVAAGAAAPPATDEKQKAKRRMIWIKVCGPVIHFCAHLWLPLSGDSF